MNKEVNTAKARLGVVGAGSWGTALAKLLADKGFELDLWVFENEVKCCIFICLFESILELYNLFFLY